MSNKILFGGAGLFVMIIGIYVFFSGADHILECQRLTTDEGHCALTVSSLLGSTEREFSLDELGSVQLLESRSNDTTVYRVGLVIEGEVVTLGVVDHRERAPREQMVQEVNDFLDEPTREKIRINEDERHFAMLMGSGAFFFGLVFFVIAIIAPSEKTRRRVRDHQPGPRTESRLDEPVAEPIEERRSMEEGMTFEPWDGASEERKSD